ncbi:LAQU0S08e03906g1_1 [Lachancea quebecensis]|uniref:Alpha-1,3/1,6-mannosyltransferase ALG2 n=1 Tax=Lachancea quebecensis TaxID=1654605 RepID=A0A0P1KTM5_9SACH|nr:LAQU0S08e03906g1_1 [Lachancea quebecensis]
MERGNNGASLPKLNIAFVHPDLGIGGAERLVIDAAVGLQQQGHDVIIYTSHCDKNHCFEEVKSGEIKVEVLGDFLPTNLAGKLYIMFANMRQLYLTTKLMAEGKIHKHDLFIVDQLSTCVPLLSAFGKRSRVLFYCHFPDQLLAQRTTLVKKLYRIPFDLLEQLTMNAADCIVVNSNFTKSVYKRTFRLFSQKPNVVHPCVGLETERVQDGDLALYRKLFPQGTRFYLSVNRYERKKNIELAIKSFALSTESKHGNVKLVIAGGYDDKVLENKDYLKDLQKLTQNLGLPCFTLHYSYWDQQLSDAEPNAVNAKVLFLTSISSSLKDQLLRETDLLLYTPSFEHFGIVPLEAMKLGKPVLAVNNGGPLETIVSLIPNSNEHESTGWLRPSDPKEWAGAIEESRNFLGVADNIFTVNGPKRVKGLFSRKAMTDQFEKNIQNIPWTAGKKNWLGYFMFISLTLSVTVPAALLIGCDSLGFGVLSASLAILFRSVPTLMCIISAFILTRCICI